MKTNPREIDRMLKEEGSGEGVSSWEGGVTEPIFSPQTIASEDPTRSLSTYSRIHKDGLASSSLTASASWRLDFLLKRPGGTGEVIFTGLHSGLMTASHPSSSEKEAT